MEDQIDKKWIKEVLRGKEGIEEVLDISARPAVGENENYGSTLYRLTLRLRMTDQQVRETNLILKVKSEKRSSYSAQEEEFVFLIENKVYCEVFGAMEKLMKETGDNEERLWPRYLAHKKLYLLMEDLTQEDFCVLPKDKPLDEAHTHAVMRVYGKLHAIGMVLAQRGLVPIQSLRTNIIERNVMVFPKFYTSGVKGLEKVMQQWGPEWEDSLAEIKEVGRDVWGKMKQLALETEAAGPCVFNHGDCWTNNILFKYNTNASQPSHIRLVDFQMAHFNSPAWDLTYFFYNALLPKERFEKMHAYLETYTETFSETLSVYSFKGKHPSCQDILKSVESLSYYGFVTAVTIRPLLLACKQEGYVLESEKLLDDFPGGPQCIHKQSFYTSPQVHDILKEEVKQYLKSKNK